MIELTQKQTAALVLALVALHLVMFCGLELARSMGGAS